MISIQNLGSDAYSFNGVAIAAGSNAVYSIEQINYLNKSEDFISQLKNGNIKIIDNGETLSFEKAIDIIRWSISQTAPDTVDTKLICGSSATITGISTVKIRCPGTFNGIGLSTNGRLMAKGIAFFDVYTPGDKIKSVAITDDDNILGQGAGFTVKNLHDDEAPSGNTGWFMLPCGHCEVSALRAYRFIPSGLYLTVVGEKAGLIAGTLFVNIHWGKPI